MKKYTFYVAGIFAVASVWTASARADSPGGGPSNNIYLYTPAEDAMADSSISGKVYVSGVSAGDPTVQLHPICRQNQIHLDTQQNEVVSTDSSNEVPLSNCLTPIPGRQYAIDKHKAGNAFDSLSGQTFCVKAHGYQAPEGNVWITDGDGPVQHVDPSLCGTVVRKWVSARYTPQFTAPWAMDTVDGVISANSSYIGMKCEQQNLAEIQTPEGYEWVAYPTAADGGKDEDGYAPDPGYTRCEAVPVRPVQERYAMYQGKCVKEQLYNTPDSYGMQWLPAHPSFFTGLLSNGYPVADKSKCSAHSNDVDPKAVDSSASSSKTVSVESPGDASVNTSSKAQSAAANLAD